MTPSKHQFVGKKVKLGELCEIYSGGTPKRSVSEYWTGGNVPWVKIGDITEKYVSSTEECITQAGLNNSSAKLFKPGTLLYSIFASIGAVGILNILAATNQAIAGLVIRDVVLLSKPGETTGQNTPDIVDRHLAYTPVM